MIPRADERRILRISRKLRINTLPTRTRSAARNAAGAEAKAEAEGFVELDVLISISDFATTAGSVSFL